MVLGLEIVLEGALNAAFGDNPNFSTIFVFALLILILTISVLGILGREGNPGEQRLLEQPNWRLVKRVLGVVVFVLLIQFTGML
jgi:hypothetical protein